MTDKEWVKILKALGNEKRLKIIKLLSRSGAYSVSDVAGSIKLSFKSTSKHLNRLSQLGILESEGKGKFIEYNLYSDIDGEVKRILKLILQK